MPRPEKIIVRVAGVLFVLAAALEGLSRLADQPALHVAAAWVLMAALFAVLTAAAAFVGVIFLAGPHGGVLPSAFEPAVLILGWLLVLVVPALAARLVWRRLARAGHPRADRLPGHAKFP